MRARALNARAPRCRKMTLIIASAAPFLTNESAFTDPCEADVMSHLTPVLMTLLNTLPEFLPCFHEGSFSSLSFHAACPHVSLQH